MTLRTWLPDTLICCCILHAFGSCDRAGNFLEAHLPEAQAVSLAFSCLSMYAEHGSALLLGEQADFLPKTLLDVQRFI